MKSTRVLRHAVDADFGSDYKVASRRVMCDCGSRGCGERGDS